MPLPVIEEMAVEQKKLEKKQRTEEKRKRSICVRITRATERGILATFLPTIHSEIEKVHFPRQKKPRFVFVVCKNPDSVPEVTKSIKHYKSDDIGTGLLFPKKRISFQVDRESSGRLTNKQREAQNLAKSAEAERKKRSMTTHTTTRSVIDPTKLIISGLPPEITEKMISEVLPTCSKITSFKTAMRPLLLEFKKPDHAYQAFDVISKTPIHGIKLNVKYHRIPVTAKDS